MGWQLTGAFRRPPVFCVTVDVLDEEALEGTESEAAFRAPQAWNGEQVKSLECGK